jgi:uncharacterized protein
MKYLLVFVVVILGYMLWRAGRVQQSTKFNSTEKPSKSSPQHMVRCTQCGVHLPNGEAIHQAGAVFCSLEHAQNHKDKGTPS